MTRRGLWKGTWFGKGTWFAQNGRPAALREPGPFLFEPAASGVERELLRLVPAAVPPRLRERVLERAAEELRGAALSPWMRLAAVGCTALIAVLLALDPVQSRHERARLAALLDGRPTWTEAPEIATELAEAGIGRGTEAVRWSRLQGLAAAAVRKSLERASLEALERLKERWEYEDPENPY